MKRRVFRLPRFSMMAYCTVGSACSAMPIRSRLWYTPAIVSRSSSARASPSTIDASVTSASRVIFSVVEPGVPRRRPLGLEALGHHANQLAGPLMSAAGGRSPGGGNPQRTARACPAARWRRRCPARRPRTNRPEMPELLGASAATSGMVSPSGTVKRSAAFCPAPACVRTFSGEVPAGNSYTPACTERSTPRTRASSLNDSRAG